MANLVNGKLSNRPKEKVSENGEFLRPDAGFREYPHDITEGRYHLYVSYACPWAHRTLIVRNIKKLENIIDVSVTDAFMGRNGWSFRNANGQNPKLLAELYTLTDNLYTGKVTVPVLWDRKEKRIINNESSEIIRIFNSSFNCITQSPINLYPEHLRERIDEINKKIYGSINNGVYKAGFASTQKAYERAFDSLFKSLDEIEKVLDDNIFLTGAFFTEADIRLFTTLIRFDVVYYSHFKCNKKRITDYSNLHQYMKCIYQLAEVKSTCHFDHIKEHYYKSQDWINPNGIIPKGPDLDLDSPHEREPVMYWMNKH